MRLPVYFVNAFATDQRFSGNPAAVVPLTEWLPDALMQAIATQNNLSETAFFVPLPSGALHIRWFSPICEIAFCGHATLASAYVVFHKLQAFKNQPTLTFWADATGNLTVRQPGNGLIEMDFPNRAPDRLADADLPSALLEGLSVAPLEVWQNTQAYIAVLASEADVLNVTPQLETLKTLAPLDVCVTAPGENSDFVSRYFWPANGGAEDPVTGSIHAALAPLWAQRLGKEQLLAYQLSARVGLLHCKLQSGRVVISGQAVQYLEGEILL